MTITTPSQNKVPLYGGVARSAGVVSRAYARTTSTLYYCHAVRDNNITLRGKFISTAGNNRPLIVGNN